MQGIYSLWRCTMEAFLEGGGVKGAWTGTVVNGLVLVVI